MLSLLAFSLGASRARWDADGYGSFPLNILVSDSFYSHCVSINVERTTWPLRHTHMFVFQLDGGAAPAQCADSATNCVSERRSSHCLSQLWGIALMCLPTAIQGMAEVWNSKLLPFLCYRQLTNKTSVLVDPAICYSQAPSYASVRIPGIESESVNGSLHLRQSDNCALIAWGSHGPLRYRSGYSPQLGG